MKKINQLSIDKSRSGQKMSLIECCFTICLILCVCFFVWETLPEIQAKILSSKEVATLAMWPSPSEIWGNAKARSLKLDQEEKTIKEEEELLAAMKKDAASMTKMEQVLYGQRRARHLANKHNIENARKNVYWDAIANRL